MTAPRRPALAGPLGLSLGLSLALGPLLGCGATTHYTPALVARGELTLRYDNRFELWAAGRPVAHGLTYHGLPDYVRCVPTAHRHARQAVTHGGTAVAFSVIGGTLGVLALGGLYGLYDEGNRWIWLGSGVGAATLGTIFAGLGRMFKNSANGHAVDAMNYYNDAVGSLGATCDDLRYPPPAAPPP
jgi:hypothetical protein